MRLALIAFHEEQHNNGEEPVGKPFQVSSYVDIRPLQTADLIGFVNGPAWRRIIGISDGLSRLMNQYDCFVRFEDLISGDANKAGNSLAVIARATGKPLEEVTIAWSRSINAPSSSTYSGRQSSLDGFWTPELEEAFVLTGGDAINGRLGYPKL